MSKITHEQARVLVEILAEDLYISENFKEQEKTDTKTKIILYIKQNKELEQQHSYDIKILGQIIEKQEKLLELYKEKDKLKDFFAMGSIRAEKYKKIEKQIKELENE